MDWLHAGPAMRAESLCPVTRCFEDARAASFHCHARRIPLKSRNETRLTPLLHGLCFSLIELLITLALMIILSTMLWGFGWASRQRAQKKACEGNLSKIYLALEIYASDCGGKFPATTNARTAEEALDVLVPRYSADTGIFICPGGRDHPCRRASRFADEGSATPTTWDGSSPTRRGP